MTSEWLNPTEAAAFLRISKRSFFRYIEDGTIKAKTYKPSKRRVFYAKEDLEKWRITRQSAAIKDE